jgi:hypothetical protein
MHFHNLHVFDWTSKTRLRPKWSKTISISVDMINEIKLMNYVSLLEWRIDLKIVQLTFHYDDMLKHSMESDDRKKCV